MDRKMKRRTSERAMVHPRTLLILTVLVAFSVSSVAQEEDLPCEGLLAEEVDLLAATLGQVPNYVSTYVLIYPDTVSDGLENVDSAALKELRIAVYDGSPASAIADRAQLDAQVYPFSAGSAGKIIEDLLDGETDVGILWAPLAGLGALELDFNYELSMRTSGPPAPPPPALQSIATSETSGTACATEVGGLLDGYSVVPAEKLVPLDIRELLALQPPARDLAAAYRGADLFSQHCAKCHGPEAVAVRSVLAPVDLLISVSRFSYIGFSYIVLNGRSQRGR